MTNRDRDTIPTPSDPQAKLAQTVANLELAVMRVGECMAEVSLLLNQIKLAELTVEHRQNVQREKIVAGGRLIVDHERRLRALEGLGEPTAAE